MRVIERGARWCYLRKRVVAGRDAYREPIVEWGEPIEIRCSLQPLTNRVDAELYGLRMRTMRRLIYSGPVQLQPGDCLCVDVGADGEPDYRVEEALPWASHLTCVIERIGPERAEADTEDEREPPAETPSDGEASVIP